MEPEDETGDASIPQSVPVETDHALPFDISPIDAILASPMLYTPEAESSSRHDVSTSGSSLLLNDEAEKQVLEAEVSELLSQEVLQSLLCESEAVFPEEVQSETVKQLSEDELSKPPIVDFYPDGKIH